MFRMIVKLRVIGDLHSFLIIHADCSRRKDNRQRNGLFRRLPLQHRAIEMFSYVRREGFDIVSFDLAEELGHSDYLLGILGEGEILHFGREQGDNVRLLSFPRDRASAEHNEIAAGRPALIPIFCPVCIGETDGLGHGRGIRFSFVYNTCILGSL